MIKSDDERELDTAARKIIAACGGQANISFVDSSISRLEMQVVSNNAVDVTALREAGAIAVVLEKSMVQIIVGKAAQRLHYLLVQMLHIVPEE